MSSNGFENPFRPGAGHMPPYLAGRQGEVHEFKRLLRQRTILENLVLTGLRGVGKTVLLETLRPIAIQESWLWAGADLSESSSVTEQSIATRLLADLAVATASIEIASAAKVDVGFGSKERRVSRTLDFDTLMEIFTATPGLVSDKLKAVLVRVWEFVRRSKKRGIVFAYDEAQNISDHAEKNEYPLSVILDVFQSIQRQGVPFLLVLVGLPTLFAKLVEARTYSERMFRVMFLGRLNASECREAILKPIESAHSPGKFSLASVDAIAKISGGYPYFVQFICREVYDFWLQKTDEGRSVSIPLEPIVRKLDSDFFAARWARVTDRQRELLGVIANLPNSDDEFTVQEIVAESKRRLKKPFSSSHANQMLATLAEAGLVYKDRHGKYLFAVPLMASFIRRQFGRPSEPKIPSL